jgi:hypothetical protein
LARNPGRFLSAAAVNTEIQFFQGVYRSDIPACTGMTDLCGPIKKMFFPEIQPVNGEGRVRP